MDFDPSRVDVDIDYEYTFFEWNKNLSIKDDYVIQIQENPLVIHITVGVINETLKPNCTIKGKFNIKIKDRIDTSLTETGRLYFIRASLETTLSHLFALLEKEIGESVSWNRPTDERILNMKVGSISLN